MSMNKQLKISVSIPHPLKTGEFKELYRNTISTDSSVTFSFEKILDAFEILYPRKDTIITFTLF